MVILLMITMTNAMTIDHHDDGNDGDDNGDRNEDDYSYQYLLSIIVLSLSLLS